MKDATTDDPPGTPDEGPTPLATPAATLKVAAVARRLGVAPATLRTWARRYDLGPSAHTAGAHRQYSQEDLARLVVMRRMTLEGYSPAEAARVALATPVPAGQQVPQLPEVPQLPGVPGVPEGPEAPQVTGPAAAGSARPVGGAATAPAAREVGGARPPASSATSVSVRSLARAAMARGTAECTRQVAAHLAVGGAVETWSALVRPVLDAMAARPRAVLPGSAPDQVLASAVLEALAELVDSSPQPSGEQVLVVRGARDRDLLAHVVAGALRDEAVPAHVLPGDHDAEGVAAAADTVDAAVVVVVAEQPVGDAAAREVLRLADPGATRLVLLGPGWGGRSGAAAPVAGTDLVPALADVVRVVTGRDAPAR